MIRESLRFILIELIFLLILTGIYYLLGSSEFITHYLIQPDYVQKLCDLPKSYINTFLKQSTFILFTTLFFSVLFYVNSTRLKLNLMFWKGILIPVFWGLLLSISMIIVSIPSHVDIKSSHKIKISSEKLFQSSHVLNVNDKILFYSTYNYKVFRNVFIFSSQNNQIIYSHKGKLNRKNQLILTKPYVINNPEDITSPISKVDMNEILDKAYDIVKLNKSDEINHFLKHGLLKNYENHLSSLITNVKNKIKGDAKLKADSWFTLAYFFAEIVGIILIFVSVGILLSSKNIALLNLMTSTIIGLVLIFGLSYYFSNTEKVIDFLSSLFSLSTNNSKILSGLWFIILGLILLPLAYLKYRKIAFNLSEDK